MVDWGLAHEKSPLRRSRLGLGCAWVFIASACGASPEAAIQEIAQEECAFVERCTPQAFERRCRPCTRHEECPQGACDLRAGLCQDPWGRSIPALAKQERCADSQTCGGFVCAPRYSKIQDCEQRRSAIHRPALQRWLDRDKDPEQGCPFNAPLVQECIRQSARRSCEESVPKSCELALRDCR